MIVRTVNQRDRTSETHGLFDRRNIAVGTICMLLYVELSMALSALLRKMTGKDWFIPSLVAAFLLVTLLYGKLDEWFGQEPSPRQRDPRGPPTSREY